MQLFRLEREQVVNQPLAEVFPFFESPENLHRITPPSLDFRLLTPSPVPMNAGRVIDYTIRFKGLKLRWRTLITDYAPPHRFTDEQLKGPYSYWQHVHEFEDLGGQTRLTDFVTYGLPVGLPDFAARLLNQKLVRPELEEIFDYRYDVFRRLFGEGLTA